MTTPAPKTEAKKIPELALHPLCTIIPPCTDEEFKELKADIKTNGLQVPIKLLEGKSSMAVVATKLVLSLRRSFGRLSSNQSLQSPSPAPILWPTSSA
jgi:hypothetical protein